MHHFQATVPEPSEAGRPCLKQPEAGKEVLIDKKKPIYSNIKKLCPILKMELSL
ncbi:MAG: hypothetical protein LBD24_09560 [Spirochaetaceae bacterium]|nr:hypothetical protein [Spirochaetaceae bacterium]